MGAGAACLDSTFNVHRHRSPAAGAGATDDSQRQKRPCRGEGFEEAAAAADRLGKNSVRPRAARGDRRRRCNSDRAAGAPTAARAQCHGARTRNAKGLSCPAAAADRLRQDADRARAARLNRALTGERHGRSVSVHAASGAHNGGGQGRALGAAADEAVKSAAAADRLRDQRVRQHPGRRDRPGSDRPSRTVRRIGASASATGRAKLEPDACSADPLCSRHSSESTAATDGLADHSRREAPLSRHLAGARKRQRAAIICSALGAAERQSDLPSCPRHHAQSVNHAASAAANRLR
jgi:hypothetical protein